MVSLFVMQIIKQNKSKSHTLEKGRKPKNDPFNFQRSDLKNEKIHQLLVELIRTRSKLQIVELKMLGTN